MTWTCELLDDADKLLVPQYEAADKLYDPETDVQKLAGGYNGKLLNRKLASTTRM